MRRIAGVLFSVVACASNADTSAPSTSASAVGSVAASVAAPTVAPPTDVHIELTARKSTYFLGENVLIDFCVVNSTSEVVTISVGGDYRGSSRSSRFKVSMRDEHGVEMSDPDPPGHNFGGLGYSPEIKPQDRWCQSLPLMHYARIDSPGTYAISATHDLGWHKRKTPPTGTMTITFVMPNAAQAETVAAAMDALPKDPNNSAGKPSVDYQDFSAMRYDVFTALLAKRARAGSAVALEGLANIPTTNATREIIALLSHASKDVAQAAAGALAMRLPDPALNGQLGARNPFDNDYNAVRKYLSSHAWDPTFANDVKTAARARLASTDLRDVKDAAFMLEAVGTSAEVPDLVKALDSAIDKTRTEAAETSLYPVPRGACQELLRAAEMIIARGYVPGASPKSLGEIAMWLVAVSHTTTFDAATEAELAHTMKHSVSYVRQLAIDHVPAHHLTAGLSTLVAANLTNADPDVVVAAAQLAEREHATSLAPNVVNAMSTQSGLRLNIVSNAAASLGARYARAKALVARMNDKTVFDEVMAELSDYLDTRGRSSNGEITNAARAALLPRWKAFVDKHRVDIEANKKIALTDPSVTPDLVPPNWKLTRADGTEWP